MGMRPRGLATVLAAALSAACPAVGLSSSRILCSATTSLPVPWHSRRTAQVDGVAWIVSGSRDVSRVSKSGRKTFEPSQSDLHGVFFLDKRTGWVVGSEGTILRTGNGGKTWARHASPVQRTFLAVTCTTARDCWILADDGALVATIDGGRVWSTIGRVADLPSEGGERGVGQLFFLDRHHGWVVHGQSVQGTVDGGRTWARLTDPFAVRERAALSHVRFGDARVGWVAYENRLAVTSDGGTTWKETLDVGKSLRIAGIGARGAEDVYVSVDGDCRALDREGTGHVSADGGAASSRHVSDRSASSGLRRHDPA